MDAAQPIGYGQTISQPSVVRMMLRWLDVKPGDKILDVGSGSGWTTAILSRLAGQTGFVFATEKIRQLVDFGRDNCARLQLRNVTIQPATSQLGMPERAPFDRILASAAAERLPEKLLQQLRPGGIMVAPVGSNILVINTDENAVPHETIYPGFAFVPLV